MTENTFKWMLESMEQGLLKNVEYLDRRDWSPEVANEYIQLYAKAAQEIQALADKCREEDKLKAQPKAQTDGKPVATESA